MPAAPMEAAVAVMEMARMPPKPMSTSRTFQK